MPPDLDGRCCGTCWWWMPMDDLGYSDLWKGDCRRHAPTVVLTLKQAEPMETRFPETRSNEGCGDWERHHHEPKPEGAERNG